MRRVVLLAVLLALVAPASTAGAQTLRGTIVEQGTGNAVGGALVLLIGPDGAERGSTASGTEGTWVLRAPSPGEWSLRVERIGFASSEAGPFRLAAAADVTVPVEVSSVPVALPAITVESEAEGTCHLSAEQGEVVWRLWDEARKALQVSTITADDMVFETAVVERFVDPFDNLIGREHTDFILSAGRSPFRVPTAEDLHENGFVRDSANGRLAFWGPDASVLLSDTFQETHCFAAVGGKGGLVGLAFRPAQAPLSPDIRGTMWLDRATSELQTIEFEYDGMRERHDLGIGPESSGLIVYDRLEDGRWILRHWRIRVPLDSTQLGGRTYKVYAERAGTVTAIRPHQKPSDVARPVPSVYDHGARRDTTSP